jgi:hypothetical protein
MARWSDDDVAVRPHPASVNREPPPGSVLISGVYAKLTEMARERIARGDPDPRCALDGSEDDPNRFDPERRGNVENRAELAALPSGDDVTVPFSRMMADLTVTPLFPRGIRRFHVGADDYVWPADPPRRPR